MYESIVTGIARMGRITMSLSLCGRHDGGRKLVAEISGYVAHSIHISISLHLMKAKYFEIIDHWLLWLDTKH
jgi:hypothetical protein